MREDTARWVKFAEYDLRLAEAALENGIYVYAAYHAQQAVEKLLKAYLIEHGHPYPKTHDIKFLIKKCAEIDSKMTELLNIGADKLTIYATEARYPEADQEVTKEEATEALTIAKKTYHYILQNLRKEHQH